MIAFYLPRMPISRIRCKPGAETGGNHSSSHLIAATYVSGYLRIWNYENGLCVGQVFSKQLETLLKRFFDSAKFKNDRISDAFLEI